MRVVLGVKTAPVVEALFQMARRGRERELLARIAAGDIEAVGELYARYAPMLFAIALRIVGERSAVEDILHDAFVLAMDRAGRGARERASVGAWLVSLVCKLSVQHVRRGSHRRPTGRRLARDRPSASEALAAIFDDGLQGERFRRAFDGLGAAQRRLLEIAFFEGLTYAEIARRENIRVATARSRAARALAVLRAALTLAPGQRSAARIPTAARKPRR